MILHVWLVLRNISLNISLCRRQKLRVENLGETSTKNLAQESSPRTPLQPSKEMEREREYASNSNNGEDEANTPTPARETDKVNNLTSCPEKGL